MGELALANMIEVRRQPLDPYIADALQRMDEYRAELVWGMGEPDDWPDMDDRDD